VHKRRNGDNEGRTEKIAVGLGLRAARASSGMPLAIRIPPFRLRFLRSSVCERLRFLRTLRGGALAGDEDLFILGLEPAWAAAVSTVGHGHLRMGRVGGATRIQ
jgi:hypothetical protein